MEAETVKKVPPGRPLGRYGRAKRGSVLLREPEVCAECNRVYLSLYELKSCVDHDGLDRL